MAIVKKIKDFLRKYFITGLLVVVPAGATIYILRAILGWIDNILGDVLGQVIGHKYPGLGIITLIILILVVGMLSANYLGTRLVRIGEGFMQRLPFVRGVYSTVKQIMETFSIKQNFRGVALVEYPRAGCWSVGFVTGDVAGPAMGMAGRFKTVFVPTTPNPTAGFLLILPEGEVTLLDMSVEEGMKFIVSLGLIHFSETGASRLKAPGREALS